MSRTRARAGRLGACARDLNPAFDCLPKSSLALVEEQQPLALCRPQERRCSPLIEAGLFIDEDQGMTHLLAVARCDPEPPHAAIPGRILALFPGVTSRKSSPAGKGAVYRLCGLPALLYIACVELPFSEPGGNLVSFRRISQCHDVGHCLLGGRRSARDDQPARDRSSRRGDDAHRVYRR